MGAILKFAFKTANKKVYLIAGSVGVLMGLIIGGAALMGNAIRSDMTGDKVAHANCTVTDKQEAVQTNGKTITNILFRLTTSCGNFETDRTLYETIAQGKTYNLTSTVGNWANKPTVTSAEIAGK